MDLGDVLWLVIDVGLVAILGIATAYAATRYKRRDRSKNAPRDAGWCTSSLS
jgi:hypothetical protein